MRAGTPFLKVIALSTLVGGAVATADEPPKITSDTFGALEARSIGPAVMSGRIAAIDAVPADPLTIYVGAATGGLWKSINSGITFKPVFDEHTMSIGAVRIDPSSSKTVWVGTGEAWTRNSISVGDGVYKSTDAGETWTNLGLKDSEHIARIQVDPKSSDTVLVCALGHLWNANEERGVFRTTDGGKTWKKVLYVDADTGCSDLSMDPQDPRIVFAGMWTVRRSPDFFKSGGKGSGLYKSTDGGETWKRLENGLPKGELGRVAVAVAPSRPSVVYSVVEVYKATALYRSDDSGASWAKMNDSMNIQVRPFYFATLVVDPVDFNTVYKPGFTLTLSIDGGKTFTSPYVTGLGGFGGGPHSDHHALWIDPRNPRHLLLGTDGGLYISESRGAQWVFAKNLPVPQFYHVSVDDQEPYHVYGGLQDNSSWRGSSRGYSSVAARDWLSIGTGDGFWAYADPKDADYVYSDSQGGDIIRACVSTGEVKDIKPYPAGSEKDLRFNWNSPIVFSPTRAGTLYLGSQVLFRSSTHGDSWDRISPDLTTNDPKRQRQKESGGLTIDNSTAENNATIYTISESPKNPDVVWAGTDDGNVQLTRDGGKTWTNLIDKIPGAPKGAWVSKVAAGRYEEGTAFVTIDDHRRGDMKPYLWRTRDFGATWESLVTPEVEGYAWVILEDTTNPKLLFLGTEFGLFVSVDGGAAWARFKGGLPARVAVHDLVIQERKRDLVIATHGRGVYILDDITPLRALTKETVDAAVSILPTRPAERTIQASIGDWFSGDDEFAGANPPEAATIVYWMKKRHLFGDLKAEIYDADGHLISTIPGTKRVGLNRILWPMRKHPPKMPPATNLSFVFQGPRYPEGTYKVKLIKGKDTYESTVTLVPDPRNQHSKEDRTLQSKTEARLYEDVERLTYVAESLQKVRDDAKARGEKATGALKTKATKLSEAAEEFRKTLVSTSEAGWISGDEKLREKLGNLFGSVNRFEGRPSDSQLERTEGLEKELVAAESKFKEFVAKQVAPVSDELVKAKLDAIAVPSIEDWKKKDEQGGGSGSALSEEALESIGGGTALADLAGSLRLAFR